MVQMFVRGTLRSPETSLIKSSTTTNPSQAQLNLGEQCFLNHASDQLTILLNLNLLIGHSGAMGRDSRLQFVGHYLKIRGGGRRESGLDRG